VTALHLGMFVGNGWLLWVASYQDWFQWYRDAQLTLERPFEWLAGASKLPHGAAIWLLLTSPFLMVWLYRRVPPPAPAGSGRGWKAGGAVMLACWALDAFLLTLAHRS
jgi:hypothetical protein